MIGLCRYKSGSKLNRVQAQPIQIIQAQVCSKQQQEQEQEQQRQQQKNGLNLGQFWVINNFFSLYNLHASYALQILKNPIRKLKKKERNKKNMHVYI